jgi:predicted enzyme related to lactoylglutathione lyase
MNNRVIHFEVQADNIERAKKFYEEALGWKIDQMMTEKDGGMNYWGITTGEGVPGINGGMYERPKEDTSKYYVYDCTVSVEDIDKAIEAVKAAGGMITREKSEIPHVGFFAMAKDTEGNSFGLMQPTEWKAS